MNIPSITTAVRPDTSTIGELSERTRGGGSQGFVIVTSPRHPPCSPYLLRIFSLGVRLPSFEPHPFPLLYSEAQQVCTISSHLPNLFPISASKPHCETCLKTLQSVCCVVAMSWSQVGPVLPDTVTVSLGDLLVVFLGLAYGSTQVIRNPIPRCSLHACYPVCQDNSPLGAGVIEPGHMGGCCYVTG